MDASLKPRLRGVFHQYAFYVALVAGVALVAVSDSGRELVAIWIYAAALAAMFGVSALYHRVDWKSLRVRDVDAPARPLDDPAPDRRHVHAICAARLRRQDRGRDPDRRLGGAAAGLVLNLAWVDAPKWLTALVFIALGWVGVVAVPEMLELGVAPGGARLRRRRALYARRARVRAPAPEPGPGRRSATTRSSTCS